MHKLADLMDGLKLAKEGVDFPEAVAVGVNYARNGSETALIAIFRAWMGECGWRWNLSLKRDF